MEEADENDQGELPEEDESDDSDEDYDMNAYDDDGHPLADSQGQTLIPFDPGRVYSEEESLYLCAFAGTYREVRGALQATRVG